ncbi:MAG: hypothetical protein A2W05_09690 [Candidatus Schekmanbacteria bacterium RBG_16_38_10]|uniref:Carrier domain-containing protein n=1 Tax=Candidatus Schekmanbacteria bacterium RBG_16_38_10 TaxID=1817879 RepID=A0A1F7RYH9_9BACT|nr:MAG: hypothetical protein A2W05_09690 [Candidatus Schekmanbacteria bacterium RBG_16_38_10]
MESRIKNVMASVFEVDSSQINNDTSPDTLESWDSLKHMNLILALEEEFGVEFDNDDITNMINFNLILLILKEKA